MCTKLGVGFALGARLAPGLQGDDARVKRAPGGQAIGLSVDHSSGENPMSVTIYGIKNCDTMKKARAWLDAHGVAYRFHDYKQDGIDKARLAEWVGKVGWETLLNRAGTTFRKLPDAEG